MYRKINYNRVKLIGVPRDDIRPFNVGLPELKMNHGVKRKQTAKEKMKRSQAHSVAMRKKPITLAKINFGKDYDE